MIMPQDFFQQARDTYVACNAGTWRWVLDRSRLHGSFLNTKQNSITLADYGPQDGLRGPDYLYGWIQGRGLESVVTHAEFFAHEDPELTASLDIAGRALYGALDALQARDGHAYFCYDADLRPIYAGADGTIVPQGSAGDIYTYSDAFVCKGLLAAATRYAPADVPRRLAALAKVIDAIEANRFLMAENGPLDDAALAAQHDDLGPRMILLGAAGLLTRLGLREHAAFGDRFIGHVIDRHFDKRTGLLRNVPGEDACNVGHGIEFAGFAMEYLRGDADPALLATLERILVTSFRSAFSGPGLCLSVSIATLQPTSPYCPWWSLPETIRTAALLYERTGIAAVLDVWRDASAAFFGNFWRGEPALAYQTMTADGPVDFVPATPDLDPGYHTGLSLLAAIEAADRLLARGRTPLSSAG
jgi:mannose/cellobiose epimerase-like protein (N-acyl-D-glucosamine 2-epimerase family)